jgi:hypothetical protein
MHLDQCAGDILGCVGIRLRAVGIADGGQFVVVDLLQHAVFQFGEEAIGLGAPNGVLR